MKNLFTVLFFITFFSFSMIAGIIYVPGDQPSIQEGINTAIHGDTVLVADSLYYENINFKGKAITVASHFLIDGDTSHISATIIDGSQPNNPDSGSVVYFISGEDTNSVVCGFTITGGTGTFSNPPVLPYALRTGGGIFCSMSGGKIKNNIIIGNECLINSTDSHAIGGGITAGPPGYNSYVIIELNTIKNNLTWSQGNATDWDRAWAQGGGITVFTNGLVKENEIISNQSKSENGYGIAGGIRLMNGTTEIFNNNVSKNSSISISSLGFAGGIGCSAANTIIDSNRITNNFSAGASICYGAAIYFDLQNDAFWAVVKNNYISGNYHTNGTCYGGGIGVYTSSPDIIKNIFKNNSADYGGTLYAFVNSKPNIINNTISDNTASQAGGAIYTEDATTNVTIMNSILWNDTASGLNNEIFSASGSIVSTAYSDINGGWTGEGNINADPLFSDTSYHLGIGSPCIDAGNPDSLCNDYDGTRNDMGAYGGIADSLAKFINILSKVEDKIEFPQMYILKQNYPNPFNPTTTIEFSIPKAEFVTLKIYNLLGQEVKTIVSDKLNSGSYKYTWDASGFASGIYYYKIDSGTFTQTKKLILLK